ncbi:Put7p KNAG_0F03060 [Huiozyma naganishii CBS 8797]|uniref:Uncharacterized protein n=1 Tax=Huiozyma naganishii (strain ATCC MYA-139 / BCRC 22969 / CBS 8797 / KCTC 17520 / NBRC 10181 / NCYC 3082 / Yp74L-3) TaxID=1071383 RepID=J7RN67_HUIN7|nr:hypothetical protein KNAG_0F03060 [Kazachstania naganishii CBS 8797]CCK70968.1 hypothetical protein KNAG_0F03060 [Kazachstania naganishii CBS 8797]
MFRLTSSPRKVFQLALRYARVERFHGNVLCANKSMSIVGRNTSKVRSTTTTTQTPKNDLIKTLSEQLILETHLNLHKPTRAENQMDTMQIYRRLTQNKGAPAFNRAQSLLLLDIIRDLLNDNFYNDYNDKFLRDFEIDKQLHLYHSLESEIHYIIDKSRSTELNRNHLQLMRLQRDLGTTVDEINELIIDSFDKDAKLELNQQKSDNTLLYNRINLNLNDCTNKITVKIVSGIKSEIENLRWQTTRSGLLAIIILASLLLTGVVVSNKKSRTDSQDSDGNEVDNDVDIII